MNKQYIFILVILIIFICVNIIGKETFITNKYNIILINHNNYKIIIVKNTNNTNNTNKKIYKIYKN
jgi:hypothetical protein